MQSPQEILKRVFGYDTFRGEQQTIISHVVSGGDALVLMPTGGGKSLCYQIPALIRPGVGVVISPLIALMQDQVTGLRELGIEAACLNSALAPDEAREVKRKLMSGKLDLLYVAPERLLSPGFLEIFENGVSPALFAIDEAHCVSHWGHDFRPEYRQLDALHQRFPDVPRIALTATADPPTRREIIDHLALNEASIFAAGFDRPNIQYRVAIKDEARKQLLRFLRDEHPNDAGIVYCLSRKKVEETAQWLSREGFRALPYHAGLSGDERQRNQTKFIREDGVIVVATIAFGMGIDKPDVRFVAHLDLPKSMEAYYQETGRAGRDGLPATAWLTYGLSDIVTHRQMIESSDAEESRKRVEARKLQSLSAFAESVECRRQVLLRYFGEEHSGACGNCDNCLSPPETWDGTVAAKKALSCIYRTGQRFGANYLADVLVGAENERITRFRHNQISTFGIGKELSEKEWLSVYRQLAAAGFVTTDIEGYGGLSLSPTAEAVLRGDETVRFRKDDRLKGRKLTKAAAKTQNEKLALDEESKSLFHKLRHKRLMLAKAQNVPPYVIFHDRTLTEMARQKPKTLEEMATIPGVGEHKLSRYGQIFLDELLGEELLVAVNES